MYSADRGEQAHGADGMLGLRWQKQLAAEPGYKLRSADLDPAITKQTMHFKNPPLIWNSFCKLVAEAWTQEK